MKRKTVIVIIVIVVIILIAVSAWLLYKKFNKKEDTLPSPDLGGGSGSTGGGYSQASFPIKKGMSGSMISDIQDSINKKCKTNLITDGAFGPKTESALKSCYGTTTVNQELYTQMKIDGAGSGCPEGQYKVPGIGCLKIGGNTPVPVATGLQKGNVIFAKMPSLVLFSTPSGNSSIGRIGNNFDISKPIGIYETASTEGFVKIWLNVSYVTNNGGVGHAPVWVYVYSNLIKK